ncbi:MAG: cell division protein FtsA [Patescibacteria group bacterium]|nr:cell division protein FtsA [Patescibacteria group bacterium]
MPKDRIVAGIDIGSHKICTIISQVSENKISVIGVSSTPSKGIKKGVVVDIDQAVAAISQSLEASERMAGYAVTSAFIGVDGSHISSLNSKGVVAVSSSDGEISEEDVARATEAAQAISIPTSQEIIHVIPRDFIVDSQEGVKNPVGMSGIRLEVETNIIYGSATSLRNLTKCVAQVGVDVSDLVFSGIAASQSVLTDTEKELGTVLVDVGAGTTKICIFEGGSPYYSSVLPIGGQNITNDLAIGLRTSIETAEKAKIKLSQMSREENGEEITIPGLGADGATESVSRKNLEEIVRVRLSEIFSLVGAEVKKSGLLGKVAGGLVLTGGGSETRGAAEVARSVLKMPVRLGAPTGVTGLIDEIVGPAYSGSVGLVIYGSKAQPVSSFGFLGRGGLASPFSRALGWFKSFLP